MKRYTFAPMLGPADPHPIGSIQRAICLGNEFDYKAERATERVDDIHAVLRRVIDERPWEVADNPIGSTLVQYVFGCPGFTYRQLYTLVDTFKRDHGLPADVWSWELTHPRVSDAPPPREEPSA